jgi:hypothetical protein
LIFNQRRERPLSKVESLLEDCFLGVQNSGLCGHERVSKLGAEQKTEQIICSVPALHS